MIEKMLGINPDQIKQVAGKMQSDLTFFRESLDYHSDQMELINLKLDTILKALDLHIPEVPEQEQEQEALTHD